MLFSEYYDTLVNFDQVAVGGYPAAARFWRVILPGFQNRLYSLLGPAYFQRKIWSEPNAPATRTQIPPSDLLRFEDHGVFAQFSGQSRYELVPNFENKPIPVVQESSTTAGYPTSYRLRIGVNGDAPSYDAIGEDYTVMVLDLIPVSVFSIRANYITRFPVPPHPGGVWQDVDLRLCIPGQFIPALTHFHRASIFHDREGGNKDSRHRSAMEMFDNAVEDLFPIMQGGPMGHAVVDSN